MMSSPLIVFFSYTGNTRLLAEMISVHTRGDSFELRPVEAYSSLFADAGRRSKQELAAGIYPELQELVTNLDDYSLIFLGSPNWWSRFAPPVLSFLKTHNLANKRIVPFCTHGGGGLGNMMKDLEACNCAEILSPLSFQATSMNEEELIHLLEKAELL